MFSVVRSFCHAQYRRKGMNYSKYLLSFVAALALLLPATGFAKVKNSGTMVLTEPAKLGSTELAPGTYKVEWSGTGSNVKISVMQHKNTVAAVQGEVKANDNSASNNAVVLRNADSPSERQIAEIDFSHHKEALVIAPTQMNQ